MKKIICALLLCCTLLSFAGCAMISYEDTNGDEDFTLQTLTEEDILDGGNSSEMLSSHVTVNNKSTYKAKSLSGVKVLYEKKLREETITFSLSSTVSKGNARLVLASEDAILHEFDLNKADQSFTLENFTGRVFLRLAGESAEYSVSFSVS